MWISIHLPVCLAPLMRTKYITLPNLLTFPFHPSFNLSLVNTLVWQLCKKCSLEHRNDLLFPITTALEPKGSNCGRVEEGQGREEGGPKGGNPHCNGGSAYGRVELSNGFGNLLTRKQPIYTSNLMLLMTRNL